MNDIDEKKLKEFESILRKCDELGIGYISMAHHIPSLLTAIRGLQMENESLRAAYVRLTDRLRLATPQSLMAITDADIENAVTYESEEAYQEWKRKHTGEKAWPNK
jgi:hypothetical protein